MMEWLTNIFDLGAQWMSGDCDALTKPPTPQQGQSGIDNGSLGNFSLLSRGTWGDEDTPHNQGTIRPLQGWCANAPIPPATAVSPFAQPRDVAWQVQEEEHAERGKKGLCSSTKMNFYETSTKSRMSLI